MTLILMCLCLLPLRRCGYSKAKQDPEEEKMHFHNGHSKLKKAQISFLYLCLCAWASSSKVYTTFTVEGSESGHAYMSLFIAVGPRLCVSVDLTMFWTRSNSLNDTATNQLHGSHVGRGYTKL